MEEPGYALEEEIHLIEFASPLLLADDYERWKNNPEAQKRWSDWQAKHPSGPSIPIYVL